MKSLPRLASAAFGLLAMCGFAGAEPLKIAYSDWPGWVAWEIGVEVKFLWFDYVPSMDAYVAGKVDGVCMTDGDALVTGATGKPSVGIIINDFFNGNDRRRAGHRNAEGFKRQESRFGKRFRLASPVANRFEKKTA